MATSLRVELDMKDIWTDRVTRSSFERLYYDSNSQVVGAVQEVQVTGRHSSGIDYIILNN